MTLMNTPAAFTRRREILRTYRETFCRDVAYMKCDVGQFAELTDYMRLWVCQPPFARVQQPPPPPEAALGVPHVTAGSSCLGLECRHKEHLGSAHK